MKTDKCSGEELRAFKQRLGAALMEKKLLTQVRRANTSAFLAPMSHDRLIVNTLSHFELALALGLDKNSLTLIVLTRIGLEGLANRAPCGLATCTACWSARSA